MRSAPLIVAGLISLALTVTAVAQPSPAGPRAGYFVEFRARGGGLLGHTFVAYGRVDGRGRILHENHAGLYPNDEYHESLLPAVAAVPAYVNLKKEDSNLPATAVYRRRISPAQYAHLHETLRYLQGSQRRWNLFFYNCNDFAAQVAREMNLHTLPGGLMRPNVFVNGLRALNGP